MNEREDFIGQLGMPFAVFMVTLAIGLYFTLQDSPLGDMKEDEEHVAEIQIGVREFDGKLPTYWEILNIPNSPRGWKCTGNIRGSIENAIREVDNLMRSYGYFERMRVGDDAKGEPLLLQYETRLGHKTLWSIGFYDGQKTRFSWGVPK